MSDFGDNFITITDEDGVDYELEILATVENGGNLYYALAPAGDDEAEEELEISILKVVEEDGEELAAADIDKGGQMRQADRLAAVLVRGDLGDDLGGNIAGRGEGMGLPCCDELRPARGADGASSALPCPQRPAAGFV